MRCWPTRTCAACISASRSVCNIFATDMFAASAIRDRRHGNPIQGTGHVRKDRAKGLHLSPASIYHRDMKPRLQTSLGQQLVLTPQLRQALHLLQLSSLELENEITACGREQPAAGLGRERQRGFRKHARRHARSRHRRSGRRLRPDEASDRDRDRDNGSDDDSWEPPDSWNTSSGGAAAAEAAAAATKTARTQWTGWSAPNPCTIICPGSLHLTRLSPQRPAHRRRALIDAIDDDGYLRESRSTNIAEMPCAPNLTWVRPKSVHVATSDPALRPAGHRRPRPARMPRSCSSKRCPTTLPARSMALQIVAEAAGAAAEDRRGRSCRRNGRVRRTEVAMRPASGAFARPAARARSTAAMGVDTYITPDCVIWRHQRPVAGTGLAGSHTRLTIHRGYEGMIQTRQQQRRQPICAGGCRRRAGCSNTSKRAATRCSR